jgi:hypothetical protein
VKGNTRLSNSLISKGFLTPDYQPDTLTVDAVKQYLLSREPHAVGSPLLNNHSIVCFGGCFAISLTLVGHAVAEVASMPQDSLSCRRFSSSFTW